MSDNPASSTLPPAPPPTFVARQSNVRRVQVADLRSKPDSGAVAQRAGLVVVGLVLLAFGFPMWIAGAWFTVRGWTIGLNILGRSLLGAGTIPIPDGSWRLLLVPAGLGYSIVEIWLRPGRRLYASIARSRGWGVASILVILWLLVICTDVGSTYLSIIYPDPGASAAELWLAANSWAAGVWASVLTFLPEGLILTGGALIIWGDSKRK